jgi:hypothetical protein
MEDYGFEPRYDTLISFIDLFPTRPFPRISAYDEVKPRVFVAAHLRKGLRSKLFALLQKNLEMQTII